MRDFYGYNFPEVSFICVMDNILYHFNNHPPNISLPLHYAIRSHRITWECDLQFVKIAIETGGKDDKIFLMHRILKVFSQC